MTGLRRLFLALTAVLILGIGTVAGARAESAGPAIVKAQGGQCVDDPAVMRRHHFDFLKHQRDDTLRQGIRGAKYSLKDCVSCHAAKDAAGKSIPVTAPGQFCQSCHSYASVKIDCFSCHAVVPDQGAKSAEAR